jgi:hypothetical protein
VTHSPVAVLHKISALLLTTLKPLGIWGLGALALIDSGFFPIPVSMDGVAAWFPTTSVAPAGSCFC